jgi:hypothetical protein
MYSLRQGRAFLNEEEKINDKINVKNASNIYLAKKNGPNGPNGPNEPNEPNEPNGRKGKSASFLSGLNPMHYFKKMVEPFDNGSGLPTPATASSSAASAPETVSKTGLANIQKLNDAFDSKMNAYSSAVSEYNKEILNGNTYFVVQVKTLTPINSCFNCDASLGGTDCSAMGVSNSNGETRSTLPNSTLPTANLLPCVQAGVTVPGWSANPNDSGSCIAPLADQKCCPTTMFNGQPVCIAGFNNYDENAMNYWMSVCVTPPSPDEINQRIALANEYCQGNGIDLNYWSKNANNFALVTTDDPANNIRPFAKMNSVPVWIVNTFTNEQDANKAKMTVVFSPTIQSALKTTRDDMMNAGAALIKALSSQQTTTAEERKNIEQQLRSIETKMTKLASQSRDLDISLTDAEIVVASKNKMNPNPNPKSKSKSKSMHAQDANANKPVTVTKETFLGTSLLAQEKDARMQFESNYTFYTVWFVIAAVLIVIMFSNFFYTSSSSDSGSSRYGAYRYSDDEAGSSSYVLGFGVIAMLIFIYFIIQFFLARFNVSRPQLPFESVNPLFVFKSNS